MIRRAGVRIELDPTEVQRDQLLSFAGTSRFVWNWALAEKNRHYREEVLPSKEPGQTPVSPLSSIDLTKLWTQAKVETAPWSRQIASIISTTSIQDLCSAFGRYFAGKSGSGPRVGLPRFKAKGRCRDSFRIAGDATEAILDAEGEQIGSRLRSRYQAQAAHIAIPRMDWIRVKEDPTPRIGDSRITSVTISRQADRWYASIAVKHEVPEVIPTVPAMGQVLGIDLGIKTFAVCSDGSTIISPRPLQAGLDQIRRQNRDISRKRNVRDRVPTARMKKRAAHEAHQQGERYWPDKKEAKTEKKTRRAERAAASTQAKADLATLQSVARDRHEAIPTKLPRSPEIKSNRLKAADLTLARDHRRVANRRENFLHNVTTRLVRRAAKAGLILSIEDLRIKNLMALGTLARSFADLGLGEFRRQLTYKAEWAGVPLFVVPTFYPSSKTCSRCGEIKADLTLSDRIYVCARCGLVIDRDLNAARNIRAQAVMAIARGESIRPGKSGQDSVSRKLTPQRKPTKATAAGQAQRLSEASQALPVVEC